MPPAFVLRDLRFYTLPTQTRFPFHYGIASMTAAPHVVARAEIEMEGVRAVGQSSEGLPPKWFTKNPATRFSEDLPEMVRVIECAAAAALAGNECQSFFSHWQNMYFAQEAWAEDENVPPLLANLGVSLVERAILDAFCRAVQRPLHAVLMEDLIGLELAAVRPELAGVSARDFLPLQPLGDLQARHTVGLADPLDEQDAGARPNDGLPFTLKEAIDAYGLRYFKIKLSGKYDADSSRLARLATLLPDGAKFTVDGNENFPSVGEFRKQWEQHLAHDKSGRWLRDGCLFAEQPLPRQAALEEAVGEALAAWPDHPAMIIDEADGALEDLPRALDLGYAGVSHKNCKGIVKGLANAALLHVRKGTAAGALILSGEDLANLGPVALLQDCAMMAALGIAHVERNGHHYFRGLSAWPQDLQAEVVAAHPDIYYWRQDNEESKPYAAVIIKGGQIAMQTTAAAPFGCAPLIDVSTLSAGLPRNWESE